MTRKVVHMTSVHDSQDTRIFHKECRTLAAAGYEVILIVPHDHAEIVDGVLIRSVPRPRSRLGRMTVTLWQIYQAALRENADAYHFHDPELILVGLLLRLRRKRVVYDVHEDVPLQILTKRWIPRPLRRFVARTAALAERLACRCFAGVVAATPSIASKFPAAKAATVQNFPLLRASIPTSPRPYRVREPIVVYAGGISSIRGAREMVAAMALLPESLGAKLILAGAFMPPGLEAELRRMPGWVRTEYVGYQSQEGVRSLYGIARVGLALLHPVPNYVESYSTKSFEYMQAGLPVVASNFPLWQTVIGTPGAGLLVDPLDPKAIARAIQTLLEHPEEAELMGKRGLRAVHQRYNWEHEAAGLLDFYQRLAPPIRSVKG